MADDAALAAVCALRNDDNWGAYGESGGDIEGGGLFETVVKRRAGLNQVEEARHCLSGINFVALVQRRHVHPHERADFHNEGGGCFDSNSKSRHRRTRQCRNVPTKLLPVGAGHPPPRRKRLRRIRDAHNHPLRKARPRDLNARVDEAAQKLCALWGVTALGEGQND